jgi:hypothetical protein
VFVVSPVYHAVPCGTVLGMYITLSLTTEARDLLRSLTLDLTTPTGRRLTMSEVLIAALELASLHRTELLETLTTPPS